MEDDSNFEYILFSSNLSIIELMHFRYEKDMFEINDNIDGHNHDECSLRVMQQ